MRVRQVDHLLDLLEFFAGRQKPASLADVSGHFGWPRSSTYNLLSTLSGRGYLYEVGERGHFYPTARWHAAAEACLRGDPVPDILTRMADDLAELTGETITVAVPSGDHAVRVHVVVSAAPIRYNAEIGSRLPIHVTGSGQALLGLLPSRQRAQILRRAAFHVYGEGSPRSEDDVERAIGDSLRRGWFQSRSNYSVDLGGVSVPLRLDDRSFVLTVAGPLFRVDGRMAELARTVHLTVARHLGRDFLRQHVPELGVPADA